MMEGRAEPLEPRISIPRLERASVLTDGSRVPVSLRKYEKVCNQYMASVRLCMQ